MLTTNVDRAMQLLKEKGAVGVKSMAGTLGTTADSVDLILSFLEEEGLVEIKHGVFDNVALLRKEHSVAKKHEKKEDIYPSSSKVKKIHYEEPIPIKEEEVEQKPASVGIIPKFDESAGNSFANKRAKVANMMIRLLEKSQDMMPAEKPKAEAVVNDVIKLAKPLRLSLGKDSVSAEFMLCELLFRIRLMLIELVDKKRVETAKEIYSSYNRIRQLAGLIDSKRMRYYKTQISSLHDVVTKKIYPKLAAAMKNKEMLPAQKNENSEQNSGREKPVLNAKKLEMAKDSKKDISEKKPEKINKEDYISIPRISTAPGEIASDIKIVNMMIEALEGFYSVPDERRNDAVFIMNQLSKIAKQSGLYSRRTAATSEFILCSLLISIESAASKPEPDTEKLKSAYNLMRKAAAGVPKERLSHYKKVLSEASSKVSGIISGAKK